ncbi:serine--tRNA ligase [Tunicatimonas pelagia]|uniref:serine--tRNA ligase n=1 Tax=Tunicatimonas pelagia TaxID=931531 RepID=UPI0026658639|nr:serine--tRNA ligase [Tunicatimonas pelagia]WKN45851.1 serine--tRNA ligase [Tunicatimonas pelagia]
MLAIATIANNEAATVQGLIKRGLANAQHLVDQVVKLNQSRKETQAKLDETLAASNNLSRQIGQLMKEEKREEAEAVKLKTAELKNSSKTLTETLRRYEEQLQQALYNIPNLPHESVPEGMRAEDNEVVLESGELPTLPEGALPHWELIEKYNIIDFALGNKISGAGFPVYKGKGAQLQRALVNFFLDKAREAGYLEVQPPLLINEDSGYGTGQLPDKEGQMYEVVDQKLFLIPTSEVPITNMYRDIILREADLPMKNTGYTPCFRREAGSWGAHVRGLNRLHQFDKVEIVQVSHPAQSYQALEEMLLHARQLLDQLELPYRVLKLCAGDMGFTAALTYDLEVYSAAQQKWLEVSSVSNLETYQANRLKLRYKDENNKTQMLHTLNGSALALPRIVAAILENNQSADGVKVPEVLVPYTGFDTIS